MNRANQLLTAGMTLFVVLLVAVPTVSAQALARDASFEIKSISKPTDIVPDIEGSDVDVEWTYTVTGTGSQIGQAESSAATLTWDPPECPDKIFVTGPSTVTIPIDSQQDTVSVTDTSTFSISATTEAPGEETLTCRFKGSVASVGQSIKATGTAQQDRDFSIAYYGLIQASSPGRLKEAGPQKPITYDITVTNFGNARTNVAFSLGSEESGSWKPILPEPLILESKVSGLGGDVQTTQFQVSTPFKNGWNNDEQTFKVVLTPTSAKSGTEGGNPVEVNVLARVRGVYVPSLEPIALVGAVLGAGMLARLRRE